MHGEKVKINHHQNLGIYLTVGRVFISPFIVSPFAAFPAIVPQMFSLVIIRRFSAAKNFS
jgi:hypothetical protein